MIVRINGYRRNIDSFFKFINLSDNHDVKLDRINEYSAISGIPLVALYTFLIEETNHDIFKNKLHELMKFYKIDEILN